MSFRVIGTSEGRPLRRRMFLFEEDSGGFRRGGESGFVPLSLADHNCEVGKKNKNVDNGETLHTRGAGIRFPARFRATWP